MCGSRAILGNRIRTRLYNKKLQPLLRLSWILLARVMLLKILRGAPTRLEHAREPRHGLSWAARRCLIRCHSRTRFPAGPCFHTSVLILLTGRDHPGILLGTHSQHSGPDHHGWNDVADNVQRGRRLRRGADDGSRSDARDAGVSRPGVAVALSTCGARGECPGCARRAGSR